MPGKGLSARLLASEGRVDGARMRTGLLSPTDWTKLTAATERLAVKGLHIDSTPGISVPELRARARRLANDCMHRRKRLALVVVDYLQLMRDDAAESREQEVAAISRGLKHVARELHIPLIALSQLNRAVETRGEKSKRPQLSDLRESGAIEQDADNICFIYREDYYRKDTVDRNIAELIIAKQRNGPTDTVRVRWDSGYTRFDNLADGEYEEMAS